MTDGDRALATARAVLEDAVLLDAHNDLMCGIRRYAGYDVDGLDGSRTGFHTDIPRMREGRLSAQVWSVFASGALSGPEALVSTLEQIDAVHRFEAAYPSDIAIVRTVSDARAAVAGGRIASFIGVEGGYPFAESPGVIRMLARLGVRLAGLTHTSDTPWAGSCNGDPGGPGLSDAGRAIVRELCEAEIVVDLSHSSRATQLDALSLLGGLGLPAMFTHSGVDAVCAHPRNVDSDVLRALAAGGGVVQIAFVSQFVSSRYRDWRAEADGRRRELGIPTWMPWPRAPRPGESSEAAAAANRADLPVTEGRAAAAFAAWAAAHPEPPVTVADVADHVDAARDIAGVAHVGIGSDFDGVDALPQGLDDVAGYPRLFAELVARGWSGTELRGLAGENALRVIREYERHRRA